MITGLFNRFRSATCSFVAVLVGLGAAAGDPAAATAQDQPNAYAKVQRWQFGAVITAGSRPCSSVLVTIPIPMDWPEQTTELVEEEITRVVRSVDYRVLDDGVKQLVALVPSIAAGEHLKILITLDVTVRPQELPSAPDQLVIPRKLPGEIKRHLNSSRLIDHRKASIRRQVETIVANQPTAWQQVQAMHQWVCTNILPTSEAPRGADQALDQKSGCGEDANNLFIAMCRSHRVPARTVWTTGGSHAEFYLEDPQGNGSWFPCRLTGSREFGSLAELEVIEQKGDNIKVPEKDERVRFVNELVIGKSRGPQPSISFVRQPVPIQ